MSAACEICEEQIAADIWDLYPDNFTDNSILTTIKEMAPKFHDVVLCKIFDEWTDCEDVLFPIYTDVGLCYTFNALHVNDIVTNE